MIDSDGLVGVEAGALGHALDHAAPAVLEFFGLDRVVVVGIGAANHISWIEAAPGVSARVTSTPGRRAAAKAGRAAKSAVAAAIRSAGAPTTAIAKASIAAAGLSQR